MIPFRVWLPFFRCLRQTWIFLQERKKYCKRIVLKTVKNGWKSCGRIMILPPLFLIIPEWKKMGEAKIQKILWRVLFQKGFFLLLLSRRPSCRKSPFSRRILLLSITKNRKRIRKITKREYRILSRVIRCRLQGFLVIWQIMGWMNFASMSTYNISFWHTEKKRTPSGNRHWITDLNIWLPGRHRMRKIWNLC